MINRTKNIYLSILLMILTLAIGLGSYAYINRGGIKTDNFLDSFAQTAQAPTFTAYSEGEITLDIDHELMDKENYGSYAVKSGSSMIHIILDGGLGNHNANCSYNVLWVWDSEDKYISSSVSLPYTKDDIVYPYELSVLIDGEEKDLSSFSWTENSAIIATRNISASSSSTQKDDFSVEVKIYNLPISQNALTGKVFKGHIEVSEANCSMQEEKAIAKKKSQVTLAAKVQSLYTVDGENNLYYHDGQGENGSLEAGDNSYRYAGSNPNNYVCLGGDCQNADNLYRIIGLFGSRIKLIKADYPSGNMLGEEGDYSNNKYDTISELALANYFGRGEKENINTYYWNAAQKDFAISEYDNMINTWPISSLNTVNLNDIYLNHLASEYSALIENMPWVVSGIPKDKISNQSTAKTVYDYEISSACASCDEQKTLVQKSSPLKIGLMYVSDYLYASANLYWSLSGKGETKALDYRLAINDNWLFLGIPEWTISKVSSDNENAFFIEAEGNIGYSNVSTSFYAVRPCFYLKEGALYLSGEGTKENPMRVKI